MFSAHKRAWGRAKNKVQDFSRATLSLNVTFYYWHFPFLRISYGLQLIAIMQSPSFWVKEEKSFLWDSNLQPTELKASNGDLVSLLFQLD